MRVIQQFFRRVVSVLHLDSQKYQIDVDDHVEYPDCEIVIFIDMWLESDQGYTIAYWRQEWWAPTGPAWHKKTRILLDQPDTDPIFRQVSRRLTEQYNK